MTDDFNEIATTGSAVAETAELVKDLYRPQILRLERADRGLAADVVALPNGIGLHDTKRFFDAWRDRPERRAGTATMTQLDSFIAHVRRFSDTDSVLFACDDRSKPSLTAVLDYHRDGAEGDPRFGHHRTIYAFPMSDEWKAWRKASGQKMNQGKFAAFLEDRVLDIAPTPIWLTDPEAAPQTDGDFLLYEAIIRLGGRVASLEKVVELSRGLNLTAEEKVTHRVNLDSGEATLAFSAEHRDGAGAPVKVPNLFLIEIPIFAGSVRYRLAVRLRYRIAGGAVTWWIELARADEAFDDAFRHDAARAAEETGLPLLYGQPEAA